MITAATLEDCCLAAALVEAGMRPNIVGQLVEGVPTRAARELWHHLRCDGPPRGLMPKSSSLLRSHAGRLTASLFVRIYRHVGASATDDDVAAETLLEAWSRHNTAARQLGLDTLDINQAWLLSRDLRRRRITEHVCGEPTCGTAYIAAGDEVASSCPVCNAPTERATQRASAERGSARRSRPRTRARPSSRDIAAMLADYRLARALLREGLRQQLVAYMVANVSARMARTLAGLYRPPEHDSRGALPQAENLVRSRNDQIACTLFLGLYRRFGGQAVRERMQPQAFLDAYRRYRRLVGTLGDDRPLPINYAWVLARAYRLATAALDNCHTCQAPYAVVTGQWVPPDCPLCVAPSRDRVGFPDQGMLQRAING